MVVIKDVAKLAGVSPSTVSKYLNNSSTLTKEYWERVKKAIDTLSYSPNLIARSMRTGQKNLIAVIVPSILNPFYSEIYNSIRVACMKKGYTLIIYTTDENKDILIKILNNISGSQVDGIILCFLDEAEIMKNLEAHKSKSPIVILSWQVQNPNFSYIIVDVFGAIYKGTKYLIDKGNKKIAYISGLLNRSISQEKLRAYKKAMNDAGLPLYDELIKEGSFLFETGYRSAKEIVKGNYQPTGIVAANDMLAIGAMNYLITNGYKIPDDIAVIGFDNIQLSSIYCPSLTTFAQPIQKMGQLATEMILAKINKSTSNKSKYFLKTKLIVRNSTKI